MKLWTTNKNIYKTFSKTTTTYNNIQQQHTTTIVFFFYFCAHLVENIVLLSFHKKKFRNTEHFADILVSYQTEFF